MQIERKVVYIYMFFVMQSNNSFNFWCMVRSETFADTGRFLSGLFTFLSRLPIVSQLMASGRKWFRSSTKSIIMSFMTTKKQGSRSLQKFA